MKTGTKVFWGVVGAFAIYSFVTSKKEPEKATAPLDYSKPVYTTDHAVICPISLLSDPRADHDISSVMNMYMSPFTMDSKAEKLGCEVWHGGIEVTARPMNGMAGLVTVNTAAFTVAAHLTNKTDDSTRNVDSTTAAPSNDVSTTLGSALVARPSSNPIPTGNVSVPSNGLGAVICPDSQSLAAYDDASIGWFASSSGPNESTPKSSIIESFGGLAKSNGCNFVNPGTSLVSEGANSIGSLALVTFQKPDGTTIRGVTFPTMIIQSQ